MQFLQHMEAHSECYFFPYKIALKSGGGLLFSVIPAAMCSKVTIFEDM